MSNTDATAESTVTEGDITVRKTYETDEFPVPTVSFELSSAREDEAMVRLVDTVPDGVPPEDLGFHPDYDSDHWSIEDDNPVFERRLDPDEEHRTVYGIRTDDHEPEQFMTDPHLDVRGLGDDTDADETDEADEAETETPGRDSSQAARDVISGDSDISDLAKPDDEIDTVDISGKETTDTTETTEATKPSGTTDETEHEVDEQDTDMAVPEGGIGAALAAELRDGDLSDSDRELLVAELTEEDAGSDVRLSHLQSRISDLEAYTDALEEFIDEHGPARQLIEDVTDQLETINDELDAVDDRTTENESAIETLDSHTAANADDIETLDEGIIDVQEEITETQDSVEELRADIEEINDWREQISSVLGAAPESEQ